MPQTRRSKGLQDAGAETERDAIAQVETNDFENQRQQNIERNRQRMEALGVKSSALNITTAEKKTPKRRSAKRKKPDLQSTSDEGSLRRSTRTRTEVDYSAERVDTLGADDFDEAPSTAMEAGRKWARQAAASGRKLKNSGAGPPPPGAPAPFGGTRYTYLTPGLSNPLPDASFLSGKRNKHGELLPMRAAFALPADTRSRSLHAGPLSRLTIIGCPRTDHPEFTPNLEPVQMIRAGIFGGCYFHPRGGKPGIFTREIAVNHEEYPAEWFEGVPKHLYHNRRYDIKLNKYAVKAGQDQEFWERKGWIHKQDPRGWFQWYTRFFLGRRTGGSQSEHLFGDDLFWVTRVGTASVAGGDGRSSFALSEGGT
eukprot:gene1571-2205_t